jgi:hypothetical protein
MGAKALPVRVVANRIERNAVGQGRFLEPVRGGIESPGMEIAEGEFKAPTISGVDAPILIRDRAVPIADGQSALRRVEQVVAVRLRREFTVIEGGRGIGRFDPQDAIGKTLTFDERGGGRRLAGHDCRHHSGDGGQRHHGQQRNAATSRSNGLVQGKSSQNGNRVLPSIISEAERVVKKAVLPCSLPPDSIRCSAALVEQ